MQSVEPRHASSALPTPWRRSKPLNRSSSSLCAGNEFFFLSNSSHSGLKSEKSAIKTETTYYLAQIPFEILYNPVNMMQTY